MRGCGRDEGKFYLGVVRAGERGFKVGEGREKVRVRDGGD